MLGAIGPGGDDARRFLLRVITVSEETNEAPKETLGAHSNDGHKETCENILSLSSESAVFGWAFRKRAAVISLAEENDAPEKLDAFFNSLAEAAEPLLLLDYDGTLAPFRVNRFTARPLSGLRELLAAIQRQGRTRMKVITGRPAAEIAPLLGLDLALEVWGLHGAERLHPDGRRELEQPAREVQVALDELRAHLKRDSLGGLFEDKANGAVMHWRGVPPAIATLVERRTRALFEPLARLKGLSLLEFEAGLELRGGRNKGGAVREILREAGGAGPVAFLGDDVTDEEAFRAVNEACVTHLSVLVRAKRRETLADVWLRPPGELKVFLRRWLKAVTRG
jgi:trehalose 6-phosphate synthase/trehalose 6-phosphate phosphatase